MAADSTGAAPATRVSPPRSRMPTGMPAATASATAVVLAQLADAQAAELRAIWYTERGTPPPATFTARLLRLALAWEAQQGVQGGKVSARDWDQVIRRRAAGARPAEAVSGLQPPPAPAGTRLMRAWGGETHEVVVLAEGVLWRGRTWSSLSVVARAITGNARNGPRFFGLRGKS